MGRKRPRESLVLRGFVPILLMLLLASPGLPQSAAAGAYGQLDSDPTLFAVMAAINAAGYDADVDSPNNHGLRKAVRDHLAGLDLPSLPALRRYVRDHRKDDPVADLSQYISFALLSKGAPDFTPAREDLPQPPDAAALFELPPLLAAFYSEANLASVWAQVQPYYEEEMAQYTDPISRAVLETNAYLRNRGTSGSGARFHVFISLLGPPHQVQTRSYLDDYYAVITPSPELRTEEIRHHYMHFLLDPLGFRFSDELVRLAPLADYALGSPILAKQYVDDYSLLATECLIKAVEAKISREPERVEQALSEGYVLTAAFYDQLPAYEEQVSNMELYFPELVEAIDLYDEAERLEKVEFTSQQQVRTIQVTRTVEVEPARPEGIAGILEDGEDQLRAGDLAAAKATFDGVLASTSEEPMQARAYYGLARLAVLGRDPETGEGLFRRVLELEPDDATRSWSLLYLGKLWDSQGEREMAQEFYRSALAVAGIPDQVRGEAEQGLEGAWFRPRN